MRALALLSIPALLAIACTATPSYEESWGEEEIPSGKADGLADLAQAIDFGQTVTGDVDSQSMVLYRISLQRGDELSMVMNVTNGDLSPHFSVFFGVSASVSSASFDVTSDKLTKTYVVDDTGTHFIAVRAFQNNGAGGYDFGVTCDAGPCNGDFTTALLKDFEADECLDKARDCSFEDMQVFNGAVGPVRARSILEECNNKLSTNAGQSCASVCIPTGPSNSAGPDDVCDSIIAELPFFADQTTACIGQLDFCMTECTSLSDNGFQFDSEEEIFEEAFSRCWAFGLNNNCPDYARTHEDCGGANEADSEEDCEELCAASSGAWADDLSSACPGDAC
jgi:hypothetical protein